MELQALYGLLWILLRLVSVSGQLGQINFVDDLFRNSNYDKRDRPSSGQGPVVVAIDLFVNGISSISDMSMDFAIDIYLRQRWTDPRLKFPAGSPYTSSITLSPDQFERLWVPDLFFTNEKSGTFHDITLPNRMLFLNPDGFILYSSRYALLLTCDMALEKFPLDNQTCPIKMESYAYKTTDLQFRWNSVSDNIQIRQDLTLPEFNVTDTTNGNCTISYNTGAFTCLFANLHITRMTNYYLIQVYAPSILIVVLSWLNFWIDIHAAPARISIGLLTVLTITTQASGISSKLPRVSYIKAIDIWMFVNMVFVFMGLLEYAFVNTLAREDKSRAERQAAQKKGEEERTKKNVNGNNRNSVTTGLAMRVVGEKVDSSETKADAEINDLNVVDDTQSETTSVKTKTFWQRSMDNKALFLDRVCRFAFPFIYMIFNIYYWCTFAQ